MKIGIFGGSFDPIHNGHINLALSVIDMLTLNKLIIIPASSPPHKEISGLASKNDRFNMCSIVANCYDGMEVSCMEIKRGGKSYTIDTLKEIRSVYKDDEIYLILGSDMFFSIKDFKCSSEIFKMCTLCVVPRRAQETDCIREYASFLRNIGASVVVLDIAPIEISSTQVRERLKSNRDISKFLPGNVEQYIREKRLYGLGGEYLIKEYKSILSKLLDKNRYSHSIKVSEKAIYLAKKYGVDVRKAELAGLLHDITKQMPDKEHLIMFEKYNIKLSDIELKNKKLWHAISGALYIKNILKIDDEDIMNSVRYHTTGRENMSELEKIIFVADFISDDRVFNGVETIREIAEDNLDKAVAKGASITIVHLLEKNKLIDHNTLSAYNRYTSNFI